MTLLWVRMEAFQATQLLLAKGSGDPRTASVLQSWVFAQSGWVHRFRRKLQTFRVSLGPLPQADHRHVSKRREESSLKPRDQSGLHVIASSALPPWSLTRALSHSEGGICRHDHSLSEKPELREVRGLPQATPGLVELGSMKGF